MVATKALKDMPLNWRLEFPLDRKAWLNISTTRLRKKGYGFMVGCWDGRFIVFKWKDI